MKHWRAFAEPLAGSLALSYLLGAIACWELNPGAWPESGRVMLAVWGVLTGAWTGIVRTTWRSGC